MKKAVLGLALGAGAILLYKELQKKGYISGHCGNELNKFMSKTCKGVRNTVDAGKNEAEYLKDRAEYYADKGKEKLDNMMG